MESDERRRNNGEGTPWALETEVSRRWKTIPRPWQQGTLTGWGLAAMLIIAVLTSLAFRWTYAQAFSQAGYGSFVALFGLSYSMLGTEGFVQMRVRGFQRGLRRGGDPLATFRRVQREHRWANTLVHVLSYACPLLLILAIPPLVDRQSPTGLPRYILCTAPLSIALLTIAQGYKWNTAAILLPPTYARISEALTSYGADGASDLQAPELAAKDALSLAHLAMLKKLEGMDYLMRAQFAWIGIRPEELSPVPMPWRSPKEPGKCLRPVALDPKVVEANLALIARLKQLVQYGYLEVHLDRLRPTLMGLEALALPAVLFVSHVPALTQRELSRADMKLRSQEYEAAASICGRALEAFLKDAIRFMHPEERRRSGVIRIVLEEHRSLDTLTLGELARVLVDGYLDPSDEMAESLSGKSPPPEYRRHPSTPSIARLIYLCRDLRNTFSHDPDQKHRLSAEKTAENAHHMMHLSRIFVSIFCSSFRIDPQAFPVKTGTGGESVIEQAPAAVASQPGA